jgi:hypothetical protein
LVGKLLVSGSRRQGNRLYCFELSSGTSLVQVMA